MECYLHACYYLLIPNNNQARVQFEKGNVSESEYKCKMVIKSCNTLRGINV